jgi:hypothetical protein
MLNEASKLGIEEILSSLDDNTIFALATTVTQGLLKNRLNTRQGTIHFFVEQPITSSFQRQRMPF